MRHGRRRSDWGPLVFVWGMWAYFAYYLVVFVRRYGIDCPYYDEWQNVPAITGQQPITLKWLWSQHNEHRIVIPRLVYLALAKLTHCDFRAGMVFNIVVLSLEAMALVVVARKMRGRTEFSDAFFPLLLLTWGQSGNLYWSFQVQFLCSAGLAVAFLVLSVGSVRLSPRALVGLGLCAMIWARDALSPQAMFETRYPTLAAPFWCGAYLTWELIESRRARRLAQTCLFFCTAALATQNYQDGKKSAEHHSAYSKWLVDDVRAGVPLREVVRRHYESMYYGGPDVLAERMRMLHAKGIGVFRYLKERDPQGGAGRMIWNPPIRLAVT